MSSAEDVRDAVAPALLAQHLVVEDVTVSPAGKRRLVRILVDTDLSDLDLADATTPVPPLSLDAVAEATRAVGDELDASDVMGEAPYVLEVSSPGVGRPLSSRDQFRRQVGRLVEVTHADGTDTGRLVEVAADRLTLEIPATKRSAGRRLVLGLDSVRRGVVQVEFKRSVDDGAAETVHDTVDDSRAIPGSEEDI